MYEQIARNERRTVACMVAFLLAWVGIGAGLGALWALTSARSTPDLPTPVAHDILTGILVAAVLALAGIAFALTSGARMVLAVSGAHPADPDQYRQLHNQVAALALGEGLPTPAVYVIDDDAPNAFATGIDPAHAAITVTTGLLAIMNREELEGVLAHEMSHIKNHDIRLLLVVTTLIGMAGLLAGLIWRSSFFLGGRGRRGNQNLMLVVIAAGVLLGILAVLCGPLVRLALSRRREYLADVSGVELTRNPTGLLHALQKLQADGRGLTHSNPATEAMCITAATHPDGRFQQLFATHPPLAARIAVLERISHGLSV